MIAVTTNRKIRNLQMVDNQSQDQESSDGGNDDNQSQDQEFQMLVTINRKIRNLQMLVTTNRKIRNLQMAMTTNRKSKNPKKK